MNLREERIQELTDLIAARMPPRQIKFTLPTPPEPRCSPGMVNAEHFEPVRLNQSPRARALRRIRGIASRYPWGRDVIVKAMDVTGAATEDDLSDDDVTALLTEIERQHDRAMHACDDEDAPPAR